MSLLKFDQITLTVTGIKDGRIHQIESTYDREELRGAHRAAVITAFQRVVAHMLERMELELERKDLQSVSTHATMSTSPAPSREES